ncbi:MAG TPA: sialate O-acetylesterase, partial [Pedobacter sp.]
MKTNLIRFLVIGLFFNVIAVEGKAQATLVMPAVFSNNMVLQQKTNVAVWGKTGPGKWVKVSTSWNAKSYSAKADQKGNWKVMVTTPSYGGPYHIDISDGRKISLKNVLIGEVWLCSGQSNMEMPLAGWGNINNYKQEIAEAKYPNIRLLQVEHVTSNQPLADAKVRGGGWQPCSPQSIPEFSSVAYFFARELYKKTGVPIGLIHSSWGG